MFWSQKFDEMHFWTTSDIRCENTELINILRKFKGSFFGSHRSCKNKTRRYDWLVLNNLCITSMYQHYSVQILCSINWYWIIMPWKQSVKFRDYPFNMGSKVFIAPKVQTFSSFMLICGIRFIYNMLNRLTGSLCKSSSNMF